eukprot:jgi/Phyca11/103818/e_gw1.8.402.1
MLVALVTAAGVLPAEVSACVPRKRLDWNVHKQTLLLEGQFKQCYRMEVYSFEKILLLIRPALTRDEVQSERRTGTNPISPENRLQMTISWLAGGNHHTTRCLGGVSSSAFYGITKDVMRALCDCEELPPTANEVPDVAAFFSGHYQMYGLNVQAICDSLDAILALPPGYYCVGDNAYPLSDSLLVPYNKLECKTIQDSDFNFYLSQLRIRIEMSFGLLVNKWQIFKRPLVVDFKNVGKVIKTCMKLHNYCINERLQSKTPDARYDEVTTAYHSLPESSYLPTDNNVQGPAILTAAELSNETRGRILRQLLGKHIQNYNLRRPRVRAVAT